MFKGSWEPQVKEVSKISITSHISPTFWYIYRINVIAESGVNKDNELSKHRLMCPHTGRLRFLQELFIRILIYRNLQNRKYVLEPGIIFTWIGNQKGEQKGKSPFVKEATENSFSDPNLSFCSSVTPSQKRFHIYIWLKSHLMYSSFRKLPVGLSRSPQKCGLHYIHMIFRCR